MLDITRHWCFESNSSSSHSFSISDEWEFDTYLLTEEWNLIVGFWEYWWEEETYSSVEAKLSYIATYLFSCHLDLNKDIFEEVYEWYKYIWYNEEVLEFERKLKEHTWAENVLYDINSSEWYPFWYIDHESVYEWENAYNDLINAVFRKNSYFETDNDNH